MSVYTAGVAVLMGAVSPMNVPEAKKTREGIEGGFCAHAEVRAVFFNPCLEAVIRDENDGRAKETQALPSPNYQQGVPLGYGSGS